MCAWVLTLEWGDRVLCTCTLHLQQELKNYVLYYHIERYNAHHLEIPSMLC